MEKKWKVLITRFLAGDAWKALSECCDVEYDQEQLLPLERSELLKRIKDKDAVISMGDAIDREMIAAAPNLKIIVDMWWAHGIDKAACQERGIIVGTHKTDPRWIIHSEVEHILMLLLAVNRRIKEADAFVREGKFRMLDQANRDMLGTGLNGKKFGILGGTAWSGAEMTKVARSFFMDVLYWDYTRGAEMEQEGALYVGFDELLRQCDFIVLVVLRGHKGGYLLDKAQFKTMKRGAVILNVTHGHLINERELVLALRDGRVGGAGLDKLERETVPADGLFDFPNVILTPHSDGAMLKERNAIFESMVSQVLDTRMKFDKE